MAIDCEHNGYLSKLSSGLQYVQFLQEKFITVCIENCIDHFHFVRNNSQALVLEARTTSMLKDLNAAMLKAGSIMMMNALSTPALHASSVYGIPPENLQNL